MSSCLRVALTLVALTGALWAQAGEPRPARRALLIGNGQYGKLPPLSSPALDVALLEPVLKALDFDVTTRTDLTGPQLDQVIEQDFLPKVRPGDIVLLYYAGYAVQVERENYLVPVDCDPSKVSDILNAAYLVSRVPQFLADRPGPYLLLLDASYGVGPLLALRGATPGLAPLADLRQGLALFSASSSVLVSAAPAGQPGVFARALQSVLPMPGLAVGELVERVRREVDRLSQGRQLPYVNVGLGLDALRLKEPPRIAVDSFTATPPAVEEGQATTLRWSTTGATEVAIEPGIRAVPPQGSREVTLAASTTYLLTASGPGGRATATVTVTLRPRPAAPVPTATETVFTNKDRLEYAWLPPGEFTMGCVDAPDVKCRENEKPAHKVRLSKGFFIGRTEVTYRAYSMFAAEQKRKLPRAPQGVRGGWQFSYPIVDITWDDASSYCAWAGGRLPTEAEWEYAARGGREGVSYPFGGNLTASRDKANFIGTAGVDTFEALASVASFDPNGFRLYDMAGNVWEWCADWYDDRYYSASPAVDPPGPATGRWHVIRGGSHDSDPREHLRISYRRDGQGGTLVGFRCALPDTPAVRQQFRNQP